MRIIVRANEIQKQEFLKKPVPAEVTIEWYSPTDLIEVAEADFFFDFCYDSEHTHGNIFIKGRLVFANSVITTSREFKYPNYVRINGWNGFIEKETWELAAASDEMRTWAEQAMNALGWKYTWVPDEPGMIAPRIIAMIINEAYFGLMDKISTKAEIDIAMKLGTNYPYGPFEWSEKIGLKHIYSLLKKLSADDARYAPCELMEKEVLGL